MRSLALLLSMLVALVMAGPSSAQVGQKGKDLSIEQLVEAVKAAYADADAMRADFVQVQSTVGFGPGEKQRGKVVFQRPKKMRWEFKAPVPKSFITDGKKMWVWSPRENDGKGQVIIYENLAASSGMSDLLADLSALDEHFSVELATDDGQVKRSHVLLATPKKEGADIKHLKLWLVRRNYQLERVEVTDQFGNVTDMSFSQVKINPANIKKTEFSFTPPPGAEVIESAGM